MTLGALDREVEPEPDALGRWRTAALILLLGGTAACGSGGAGAGIEALRPEAIDAHLRFLASDELEGRAPGSFGAAIAARYIAAGFATAGLEPAVGDTSYLQRFSLISARPSSRLTFRARGGAYLRPHPDSGYVAWTIGPVDSAAAAGEAVFVGYGIAAPDLGWDDYKGMDVAGAVVLILSGEPRSSNRFAGDTLVEYRRPAYKVEEAWRRGATAVFLIDTGAERRGEPPRFARVIERERLYPKRPGRYGYGRRGGVAHGEISGWLSRETAEQIAGMAGLNFATLLATAEGETFEPVLTGVTVSAEVVNELGERDVANVAGLLRGRDPARRDEVVILTAHYDGLGVGPAVGGDSIYNGAYDNASGVALLLALSEALPLERPARSLLFLASTASEAGGLGSAYYLERPLRPLDNTVAVLNLAGANLWGRVRDVALVDGGWTDLASFAQRAAASEGLRLRHELLPEIAAGLSSDQIVFLRAGVPAAVIGQGVDYVGRMPGFGEEALAEFIANRLNSPDDEYDAGVDLAGAVQQARFTLRFSRLLAGAGGRPELKRDPEALAGLSRERGGNLQWRGQGSRNGNTHH